MAPSCGSSKWSLTQDRCNAVIKVRGWGRKGVRGLPLPSGSTRHLAVPMEGSCWFLSNTRKSNLWELLHKYTGILTEFSYPTKSATFSYCLLLHHLSGVDAKLWQFTQVLWGHWFEEASASWSWPTLVLPWDRNQLGWVPGQFWRHVRMPYTVPGSGIPFSWMQTFCLPFCLWSPFSLLHELRRCSSAFTWGKLWGFVSSLTPGPQTCHMSFTGTSPWGSGGFSLGSDESAWQRLCGWTYHGISELAEVFHHFSFSWTKLVNGKGEQGHHSQELPSGFLLVSSPSLVQTILIQSTWNRAWALCLLLFPVCCDDTTFVLSCFVGVGVGFGGFSLLKFNPPPLFFLQNSQLLQIRVWIFKDIYSEF